MLINGSTVDYKNPALSRGGAGCPTTIENTYETTAEYPPSARAKTTVATGPHFPSIARKSVGSSSLKAECELTASSPSVVIIGLGAPGLYIDYSSYSNYDACQKPPARVVSKFRPKNQYEPQKEQGFILFRSIPVSVTGVPSTI